MAGDLQVEAQPRQLVSDQVVQFAGDAEPLAQAAALSEECLRRAQFGIELRQLRPPLGLFKLRQGCWAASESACGFGTTAKSSPRGANIRWSERRL